MGTQVSFTDYIGVGPGASLERAKLAEEGLPTESLDLLKAKGLTFTEMAAVISPRTLKHRKARGENLSSVETERFLRVASVVRLAEQVFGNSDKAMRWLRYRNTRLDDRTPLSLLQTEAGGRHIEAMLWGIDDGIFS